jgi:hypothetical protein
LESSRVNNLTQVLNELTNIFRQEPGGRDFLDVREKQAVPDNLVLSRSPVQEEKINDKQLRQELASIYNFQEGLAVYTEV